MAQEKKPQNTDGSKGKQEGQRLTESELEKVTGGAEPAGSPKRTLIKPAEPIND